MSENQQHAQHAQLIRRRDVPKFFPFISRFQLDVWAARGIGPKFFILGRVALYRREDIQEFINHCERESIRARLKSGAALPDRDRPRRAGRPKKQPQSKVGGED